MYSLSLENSTVYSIQSNQAVHLDIVSTFLASWHNMEPCQGVLLTGSYANDTHGAESDIDLRLVYDNTITYREMGECEKEGKQVSFLAMSANAYKVIFAQELYSTSKLEIRRFTVGKIIQQQNNIVSQLQAFASTKLQQATTKIAPIDLLNTKLAIGRKYKVLLEMPIDDWCFSLAYCDVLKSLIDLYTGFLCADIPFFPKKWSRFFDNESYRTANHFTAFPDRRFVQFFKTASQIHTTDNMTTLYEYVQVQTGTIPEVNFLVRFNEEITQADLFNLS